MMNGARGTVPALGADARKRGTGDGAWTVAASGRTVAASGRTRAASGRARAALRMRALYGSERQVEALKVYQEMYERLRDDLAVEPGNELRRAHEALLNQET